MRSLAVYLKNYKKESILAPFFKFLEVVFDLIVPIVIAQIIDVGIANHDNKYIVQRFFILILMAALGLASTITAQFFAAKASVGFATELRQAVYDHVQRLSFTELDTLGTDTLITRLTDDVNQIQNGLNMGLRLLLRSPFIVLGSMVMAFTIDFKCALVFAVAIPFLFLVVFVIMFLSIPLFKKVQGKLDTVTGLTRENLTGVRVIRAFCREKEAVAEFDTRNQELTKLNLFVGKLSALLNPVTYVLINIATVILIQKAGVEVNLGGMQQGQVVALYNYMAQMIVELIKLASLIITLNKSAACAGRVADILKVKSTMDYPAATTVSCSDSAQTPKDLTTATADASLSETSIAFNDVTFEYSGAGAPSLSHISFSVKKGQTVGIIGGTGSGKTTLVNLISRFYDASNGTVLLDGQNIENYTRNDLRSRIGVVPQKAALFKGSIRDNLKWGREDASDEDLWQALTTAQGKEVVEGKPGQLDFMLEQNGKNLSGGQKQRLTIARALVKKPEILILDDSASALDFATDAALRKSLNRLDWKVTTFLVSQRSSSIQQADLILVLDNGTLAGKGTHAELLRTCDTYREIYFSQFPEERARYSSVSAGNIMKEVTV
jgi:ATP-binding cassette subfamily B multidrug efflux pump